MERTKKGKNYKKIFNRFFSFAILFASIFALCYSTRKIFDYATVKQENNILKETLEDLKLENKRLEILNTKLKDSDYFSVYVKDKYQYSPNDNSIIPID